MNSNALALARRLIEDGMTKAQIAREIGFSRTAVSLYVRGCYGPDPAQIEAAIMERFSRFSCPYLKTEITPEQCVTLATRLCPTSNARDVRHWRACQACAHKPNPGDSK